MSHVVQTGNTALDPTDIGRMQTGFFGEGFLSELTGVASFADVKPEGRENGISFHRGPFLGRLT